MIDKALKLKNNMNNPYEDKVFVINENTENTLIEECEVTDIKEKPISLAGIKYFVEEGCEDEYKCILIERELYENFSCLSKLNWINFWELIEEYELREGD